jgi:hypothetical protein
MRLFSSKFGQQVLRAAASMRPKGFVGFLPSELCAGCSKRETRGPSTQRVKDASRTGVDSSQKFAKYFQHFAVWLFASHD